MGAAEPRYAEALYNAAKPGEEERIGQVLMEFDGYLQAYPTLRGFLFNPTIPIDIRKETTHLLLPKGTPETAEKFIHLLIDRRRLKYLAGICRAYHIIAGQRQKQIDIRVTTARPLEPEQLDRIREDYRRRHNAKTATLRQEIDPSLLGGVRVQIGDTVIDDTLRARLEGLREALKRM